jgi:hypothetical protein
VVLEARSGDFAAAEQSLQRTRVAFGEAAALEKPGSNRRKLFDLGLEGLRLRIEAFRGNDANVFEASAQLVAELEAVDLSNEDAGGAVMRPAVARANMIRAQLANRTLAGLRLGRYGEAEQAARQRLVLPPNPISEFDPQDEIARAKITLAHALVGQGRQDEARQVLDAELPRYRKLQEQGAQGLDFHRDLAYALYVDAIARPAQDPQRRAALVAARRTLDGLSAEARQLLDIRELYARIAAAG